MARYIMMIESNCKNPEREAEFNEWYENIHIPDVLAQPDFKKATLAVKYDSSKGGAKYVAFYEIETEDLARTMATEHRTVARLQAKHRLSDQFVLVSSNLYRLISIASK